MVFGWFHSSTPSQADVVVSDGTASDASKPSAEYVVQQRGAQARLEQLDETARELEEAVELKERQDRIDRLRARLAQPRAEEPVVLAHTSGPSSAAPVVTEPAGLSLEAQQAIQELRRQQVESAKQAQDLHRQREEFYQQQEQARNEQEQARRQHEQEKSTERQQKLAEQAAAEERLNQGMEKIAKMTADVQRLQAAEATPSVAPPPPNADGDVELERIERQVAALEEENKRNYASLLGPDSVVPHSRSRPSTHVDPAPDAELESLRGSAKRMRLDTRAKEHGIASDRSHQISISKQLPTESDLTARSRSIQQQMDLATKGMDIVIVMDCTGSMAWAISSCKRQIKAVLDRVQYMYPDAIIRVAFIGYKDHNDGNERILLHKFVDKEGISSLEQYVAKIVANGGADGPEDIAGALQTVLDLLKDREQGFRAQTRMIIHFADAPCHGQEYHSMCDDYPEGDPHGLKPEKMLRELASRNVDYYFMEVKSTDTTKMTNIFKTCYPTGVNASCGFHVLATGTSPDSFMPAMLRSITASAQRPSSYFSRASSRRSGFTGHEPDSDAEDAAAHDF